MQSHFAQLGNIRPIHVSRSLRSRLTWTGRLAQRPTAKVRARHSHAGLKSNPHARLMPLPEKSATDLASRLGLL